MTIDQEILDIASRMNLPELLPEEADEALAVLLKCYACNEAKTLREFYAYSKPWSVANRHGMRNRCKECSKAYQKTPEGKASSRNARMKRHYGIDQARYEQMLAAQGGKCAICPATEPGGNGRWHVDHDHDTGEVRGLLCYRCNVGIGHLRHSPAIMLSAVKYVTKHITPDMIE